MSDTTQLDPQGLTERAHARELREEKRAYEEVHPIIQVDEDMDIGV